MSAEEQLPLDLSTSARAGFIAAAPWRFARTVPEIPHQYVARDRLSDVKLLNGFDALAELVAAQGTRRRWAGHSGTAAGSYVYLVIGEWEYWFSLGLRLGGGKPRSQMLNRRRLDQPAVLTDPPG